MFKRLGTPALDDDNSWNMSSGVLVPDGTIEAKAEAFEQSLRRMVNQEEAIANAKHSERKTKR